MLADQHYYPLEVRIRNFKNEYCENSFVWGVFDTCRGADASEEEKVRMRGEPEFLEFRQKQSNMILTFSCEPTKPTFNADRATHAIFEWITKKEKMSGKLIFPEVLNGLSHEGIESTF